MLSDVGVEFTIGGSASAGYTFQTQMIAQDNSSYDKSTTTYLNNVSNQQFFLDRPENDTNGKFTITATTNGYTLKTKASTNMYMAAGVASGASNVEDTENAITAYTSAPTDGTSLAYATVTNKEAAATSNTPSTQSLDFYMGIGVEVTSANGAQWTMNMKGNHTLQQTVTPFKHGWYEIRCRAFSNSSTGTPVLFASVDGATSKTSARTNYAQANITKLASASVPTSYTAAETLVNGQTSGAYTYETVVRVYVPEVNETVSDPTEDTRSGGSTSMADYTGTATSQFDYTSESCKSLAFGVKQTDGASTDWLCVDNFEIEYLGIGTNAIILDETQPDISYINEQVSGKNSTIYMNRSLTAGKWNSIMLPFSMTYNDIIDIFGSGTKVSKYEGAQTGDRYTIHFKSATTIDEGQFYIIKPTVGEPSANGISVSSEKTLTLATIDASGNVTKKADKESVTLSSAYYTIPNIVFGKLDTGGNPVELEAQVVNDDEAAVVEGGSDYCSAGTYVLKYKVAPVGSYLLQAANKQGDHTGSMGEWLYRPNKATNSYGFRGWIQIAKPNVTPSSEAKLAFVFDGIDDDDDSEVTKILSDLTADESAVRPALQGVYNLQGQLAGHNADSLPKGIYIQNGKKFVVK